MKRGIVPEYGLSYFLQEQLGRQRALELILTARRIDAQEALDLGLVLEVVPGADLEGAGGRIRDGDRERASARHGRLEAHDQRGRARRLLARAGA